MTAWQHWVRPSQAQPQTFPKLSTEFNFFFYLTEFVNGPAKIGHVGT